MRELAWLGLGYFLGRCLGQEAAARANLPGTCPPTGDHPGPGHLYQGARFDRVGSGAQLGAAVPPDVIQQIDAAIAAGATIVAERARDRVIAYIVDRAGALEPVIDVEAVE